MCICSSASPSWRVRNGEPVPNSLAEFGHPPAAGPSRAPLTGGLPGRPPVVRSDRRSRAPGGPRQALGFGRGTATKSFQRLTAEGLAVEHVHAGDLPRRVPTAREQQAQDGDDEDLEKQEVEQLLDALQELRDAGAEAVQINDGRVGASTWFADGASGAVTMDGRTLSRPFVITAIGATVNNDPDTNRYMRVVFLPNFNVQNAHLIYPAANLSEQISTAGKEASGTGNMKFMINGALTIGTLDGANVEIREEAGAENFFLFGMTVDEVERLKSEGYRPADCIEGDPELAEVLELIVHGTFTHGDTEVLRPLVDNLIHHDPFLVLADYRSYIDCQAKVSAAWRDSDKWSHMSVLNTARSGKFSSDRSVADYCNDIWGVDPMPVRL